MTVHYDEARTQLRQIRVKGAQFFAGIEYCWNGIIRVGISEADHYWSKLEATDRQAALEMQSELIPVISVLANGAKQSSLLTEADRRDIGAWTKSLRASLRLRRYYSWDTELLHDEDIILGVRQAGQTDEYAVTPEQAGRAFDRNIEKFLGLIDLIEISPGLFADEFRINPRATTDYEPDSAFVMMQIDPQRPELEDRYNAIKDCFARFGITAVRADEIEHEEVITEKIMERIRSSEFLLADLTGERPSVYYEIGFAHALKRRVIMYRLQGSNLHFDLAAYNCPEYKNLSELQRMLISRLKHMTNRNPTP